MGVKIKDTVIINIECKTAREQDLFLSERHTGSAYDEEYEYSLWSPLRELLSKCAPYRDLRHDIKDDYEYLENGNVNHEITVEITYSAIIEFNLDNLKTEIHNFVIDYFKEIFESK